MSLKSHIILLVGLKGAGKTTLGRIVERKAGAYFLEVEMIAKRVLASVGGRIDEDYARQAFEEILCEVETASRMHPVVILETTGASSETEAFVASLRRSYRVHLVRVHARAESCASRIAHRDRSRQVDVPADVVETMQARSEDLQWPWDLEVVNDPPLTEEQVMKAFEPVLRATSRW